MKRIIEGKEYDGSITNISLPCMVQLEVQLSVIKEEHYLNTVKCEWENESGEEFRLHVDGQKRMGQHAGV